jgi:polyphosphate kinase
VLDLIRQAAIDPNVLAIKQTLYRTGKDSLIVDALIQAARNGKDVTVVVELRARFDEEANLGLADRLQEAGVQVVYGVVGYKTHAKMLLIVRREGRKLRRYVHLGTGNYHSGTARAYTDISLITADADIGNDVHLLFQQLSGLASKMKLKRLLQSPFTPHRHPRPHRARNAHRRRRPPGADHRQDERPERTAGGARAVRRLAGRRADRPDHPRRLHPAPACRACRTTSACARSSAASWSTAASTGSATTAHRRCTAPAPTGWNATCCAGSKPASRSSTRTAKRVYREVLQNYLDDNLNAWNWMPTASTTSVRPPTTRHRILRRWH